MTCHHAPIDHHQPIPEDETHCDCVTPEEMAKHPPSWSQLPCDCPCHGPSWLTRGDADVPDLLENDSEWYG